MINLERVAIDLLAAEVCATLHVDLELYVFRCLYNQPVQLILPRDFFFTQCATQICMSMMIQPVAHQAGHIYTAAKLTGCLLRPANAAEQIL